MPLRRVGTAESGGQDGPLELCGHGGSRGTDRLPRRTGTVFRRECGRHDLTRVRSGLCPGSCRRIGRIRSQRVWSRRLWSPLLPDQLALSHVLGPADHQHVGTAPGPAGRLVSMSPPAASSRPTTSIPVLWTGTSTSPRADRGWCRRSRRNSTGAPLRERPRGTSGPRNGLPVTRRAHSPPCRAAALPTTGFRIVTLARLLTALLPVHRCRCTDRI